MRSSLVFLRGGVEYSYCNPTLEGFNYSELKGKGIQKATLVFDDELRVLLVFATVLNFWIFNLDFEALVIGLG